MRGAQSMYLQRDQTQGNVAKPQARPVDLQKGSLSPIGRKMHLALAQDLRQLPSRTTGHKSSFRSFTFEVGFIETNFSKPISEQTIRPKSTLLQVTNHLSIDFAKSDKVE